MRFLPRGQGFLQDIGRPVSPQNAFGKYFDVAGRVPSHVFVGDSLASQQPNDPPITLVANGGALVDEAFPVAPNEGTPLESPLMVAGYQYTNAALVFHEITDTSVLDVDGTQSVAISIAFRTLTDDAPTNAGALTGKRQIGGSEIGYEWILQTDGALTFQAKDAGLNLYVATFNQYNNAAGQDKYADGRWHSAEIEFDVEAQEIRLGTEHEIQQVLAWEEQSPGVLESFVSGTTFRLGAVRGFAGPVQLAYMIASQGVQAMTGDVTATAVQLALETSMVAQVLHRYEVIP